MKLEGLPAEFAELIRQLGLIANQSQPAAPSYPSYAPSFPVVPQVIALPPASQPVVQSVQQAEYRTEPAFATVAAQVPITTKPDFDLDRVVESLPAPSSPVSSTSPVSTLDDLVSSFPAPAVYLEDLFPDAPGVENDLTKAESQSAAKTAIETAIKTAIKKTIKKRWSAKNIWYAVEIGVVILVGTTAAFYYLPKGIQNYGNTLVKPSIPSVSPHPRLSPSISPSVSPSVSPSTSLSPIPLAVPTPPSPPVYPLPAVPVK